MFKSFFGGKKVNRFGYVFIAPFFVTLAIFNIYPMLYSIYLSFTNYDGGLKAPKLIGFKNFVDLWHDPVFFKSISNTVIIWLVGFIPQMILAIALAVILTDKSINLKGKGLFRGIFYVPNLVTMASVALLFYYILDLNTGSLNKILMNLHIFNKPFDWLQDPLYARLAISFILFWMWFGYSMIIFMAGINAIPNEIFEAARVDGANKWQNFRYIILPSLKGSIIYNIITSIIGGLALFDVPYVLAGGQGSPLMKTLTTVNYMYNMTFVNWYMGYGAAIYVGLFIITAVVVAISYRMISKYFSNNEG